MESQPVVSNPVVGERPVLPTPHLNDLLAELRGHGLRPRELLDTTQTAVVAQHAVHPVRQQVRAQHTAIEDLSNALAKLKQRVAALDERLIDTHHGLMILHVELLAVKRKSVGYRVRTYLETDYDHTVSRWRHWWRTLRDLLPQRITPEEYAEAAETNFSNMPDLPPVRVPVLRGDEVIGHYYRQPNGTAAFEPLDDAGLQNTVELHAAAERFMAAVERRGGITKDTRAVLADD